MFQDEIMVLFEKHTVLTNQEIRYNLRINKNQYAVLNTEIKRLCDKDLIRRVGRGVYTIVWNTRWGKVVPTEVEITNNFYMANGEGYIEGIEKWILRQADESIPLHHVATVTRMLDLAKAELSGTNRLLEMLENN